MLKIIHCLRYFFEIFLMIFNYDNLFKFRNVFFLLILIIKKAFIRNDLFSNLIIKLKTLI